MQGLMRTLSNGESMLGLHCKSISALIMSSMLCPSFLYEKVKLAFVKTYGSDIALDKK